MRDNDGGDPQATQTVGDDRLSSIVERARCFVEDQYAGFRYQSAGDEHPLMLASRNRTEEGS